MTLLDFEEKYKFLYDETVGGVAIYTCLRDSVSVRLMGLLENEAESMENGKGKIHLRRLLDTFFKWRKYRSSKTVIFTSSVYRRDWGRNLNVEFLMNKYPDAVAFEWPSRNDTFDMAYLEDKLNYVPLDAYLVLYKAYCLLHKKIIANMEAECRAHLKNQFDQQKIETEEERRAVDYLLLALPYSVVMTHLSQRIFKWMFRKYQNIEYAIDFWGGGRENIIPVLQGHPTSVELQHGIITPIHPGYVYPDFVRNVNSSLFQRIILVFSQKEKKILTHNSVFKDEQIEVVGNPRIQMYKKIARDEGKRKKWVLFTSQPYEQDLPGCSYYGTMIPYLSQIKKMVEHDGKFQLAIKLHPRENEAVKNRYEKELPGVKVFGSSAQLYEILSETHLHMTATSSTLFEALEFDVPTVTVQFGKYDPVKIYGVKTMHIDSMESVSAVWDDLSHKGRWDAYLKNLKSE